MLALTKTIRPLSWLPGSLVAILQAALVAVSVRETRKDFTLLTRARFFSGS
jgi:hypothetical protein